MPEVTRTRPGKQGFFRIQNATNFSHWCTGKDETIETKAVSSCPQKSSRNFTLLAHELNAVCDISETIAAVGSGFKLPRPHVDEMGGFQKQIHEYYFTLKISLSRPLLVLLIKMCKILPLLECILGSKMVLVVPHKVVRKHAPNEGWKWLFRMHFVNWMKSHHQRAQQMNLYLWPAILPFCTSSLDLATPQHCHVSNIMQRIGTMHQLLLI